MTSLKSFFALLLSVVVVGAVLVTPAHAGTGTVQVTVIDNATKEAIIGATVTLSDANKQWPDQNAITNENGIATFPLVQPGSAYVVAVSMVGYNKLVKGGIRVVGGVTNPIRLPLLQDITETVIVKGKDKVVELDTDSQSKTKVSAEAFDDLPIFGRDYQAALALAPGVQDTNGDGNPNVHGSRERDFKMSLDGVSNVDPFTGKFMSNINLDAVEEMEIVDSGADASYGGAVGGFGKLTTKSGGNKFEASAKLYVRDSMFDGNGAGRYGSDPVQLSRRAPSFTVSGPILRDKLWFIASHEWERVTVPINLLGGETVGLEFKGVRHQDKLTWQVTPKNKLQLQYTADPYSIEPNGVDSLTKPESGFKYEAGGPSTQFKWVAPFTPTFFWETTVGFSNVKYKWTPENAEAKNACINLTPFDLDHPTGNPWAFFGGYYCTDTTNNRRVSGAYPENSQDKRQRWTYALDAQQYIDHWLGGQHNVKFGADIERVNYERDLSLRPTMELYAGTTGGSPIDRLFANLLRVQSDYFPGQAGQIFTNRTLLREQRGLDTSRGNFLAAYITDTYEPKQNLSISFGLRLSREELSSDGYRPINPVAEHTAYEAALQDCLTNYPYIEPNVCAARAWARLTLHPINDISLVQACSYSPDPDMCNTLQSAAEEGNPYLGPNGLVYRQTQRFTIASNYLAPTFKLRWDPRNDGKTVVSASAGRYYGDSVLQPLVFENGPDRLVQVFPLNEEKTPRTRDGSLPNPLDPTDVRLPYQIGASSMTIRLIDRNLKKPHNDEIQLQVQREIAPETSLRVQLLRRAYRDQLQQIDINHVAVTDADAALWSEGAGVGGDHAPCVKLDNGWDCTGQYVVGLVGTPNGLGGRVLNLPDGLADLKILTPAFNNIYQIGNYAKSDYSALVIELNRRFFENWEMTASYVRSRATGTSDDYIDSLQSTAATDMAPGPLSFDQPHVFKLEGRVRLPWLGGFTLGGFGMYQSGLPYSIVEERTVADFPTSATGAACPTCNTQATYRLIFVDGKRNNYRNPARWTLDLNAQKDFPIKRALATFEVKIFNILNDDTTQIAYIYHQYIGTARAAGSYQPIYNDVPVAGIFRSRSFELGLKIKWQ